jgi:hypothetical protein
VYTFLYIIIFYYLIFFLIFVQSVHLFSVCLSPKTFNFDCSILMSWFLFVATTSFPHIKLQSTLSSLKSSSYMFHKYYYKFRPKIYFTNSVLRNSLLTCDKGEGKVHTRKFFVGPEDQVYNSTLSLTSALHWGGCSTLHPCRFTPAKDAVSIV